MDGRQSVEVLGIGPESNSVLDGLVGDGGVELLLPQVGIAKQLKDAVLPRK